jgi:hypothetical protein
MVAAFALEKPSTKANKVIKKIDFLLTGLLLKLSGIINGILLLFQTHYYIKIERGVNLNIENN